MLKKARVAILVSGGGTNLQAIINAADRGELPSAELALVIASNDTAYALTRAEKAGIPAVVVSKKRAGSQQVFEEQMLEKLREYRIDLIVLAGFMNILSADFVSRYPRRILNVHPSLIPAFCGEGYFGLRVHEAALAKGVRVTGATVHFVNEIPDGGEIIFQKAVVIREDDTPETLQKRVMRLAEWKILPAAVEQVSAEIIGQAE